MKQARDRLAAPLWALLCACACLVGCGREEAVRPPEPPAPAAPAPAARQSASRGDDAAYQAQLRDHLAQARRANVERGKILERMAQMRERAKKALPAGATDAQVAAELEGNPRKYPAWRELVAALGRNEEDVSRNGAATYATVQRRIRREVAEQASAEK